MTKKEIVKTISDKIGLTQLQTKEIVQQTFDAIVDTLVEERRIELRNFGVFEVKKRAARKARNPRTGERVDVAEKYVVTFKPGKEMEEKVRMLELAEAAKARGEAPPSNAPPTSSLTDCPAKHVARRFLRQYSMSGRTSCENSSASACCWPPPHCMSDASSRFTRPSDLSVPGSWFTCPKTCG